MSQVFRPFDPLVIVTAENGKTEIPSPTSLTRLHYFDGKFLRADDLSLEQMYVRALVHLSNQAGGSGVVHGLDTTLGDNGDEIVIGQGMAIDPAGQIVLLPNKEFRCRIDELIPLTARAVLPPRRRFLGPGSFEECVVTSEAPAVRPSEGYNFYVITIGHAEALCGQEDVYGKICEEACMTSTDRPYYREGIIVRAEPLYLTKAMPASGVVVLQEQHLRSRLASALFADEETQIGSLISGRGLHSDSWCLGARLGRGGRVPLAVIARAGHTTVFLDAWVVRRERIDTPPRRYWAARMSMRPWDGFLAQVLQFQCQLNELLVRSGTTPVFDPCRDMRDAVRDAANTLGDLVGAVKRPLPPPRIERIDPGSVPGLASLAIPLTRVSDLQLRLNTFLKPGLVRRRASVLIDGGIVELPPAGYLPVDAAGIVNDQIVALLGNGLDLRFCVVTPDFVAHALEEAQHMDRISLLQGLEPGGTRPPVDILVPDGEIIKPVVPARGIGFEGELHVRPEISAPAPAPAQPTGPVPPPGIAFGPLEPARPIGPGVLPVDRFGTPRASIRPAIGEIADIAGLGDRLRDTIDLTGRLGDVVILEPFKPRPTASTVQALGAGRAEPLESGGGAFYFAGMGEAPQRLKIADLVKGLAAVGRDAIDDLKVFQKLPVEELSGISGRIEQTLYANSNMIGGRATLFNTGLRSKFPGIGDDIVRPPIIDLPDFKFPTRPAEKRLVTVWTSLRADQNPFELAIEGTTRIDLNVTVGMPGANPSWIDYRVQGQLTVSQYQSTGSIRHLNGFVHDGFAHTRSVVDGGAPVDYHDTDDISCSCQLEDMLQRQKLTVRVRHGKMNAFRIEVSWGGAPLQAIVDVVHERIGALAETLLVSGTLVRNDAVMAAGHPRHAVAVSAVNTTGALIKRPEFANQALEHLFPPAPPPPKDIQIRATQDWVLFHRRRIKHCATIERAAPVPARRYHIWQLEVPDAVSSEKVRQALLTNDPAPLPALSAVTPVEFAAGVPTLTSSVDDLRHDWARAPRGNILQYSLIASNGTLDGDVLARSRIDQVQHALEPAFLPDAQARTDVLPFVPAALAVPETDGAIVLVTRTEAKTTCHNVYRIVPHYEQTALELLKDQRIAELAAARMAVNIGRLEFKGDSAEFVSGPADRQQVLANWDSQGDGRPGRVMGFASSADAVASREPQLTDRVNAIATLLRNEHGAVTALAVPVAMPEGCAGVTFVVPAVTEHLVVAIDRNLDGIAPSVPTLLKTGALGGILKYAKPLGDAAFLSGTATGTLTEQSVSSPLATISSVIPGATAEDVFIYNQPGSTPETGLTLQAQGAAIAAAVGAPGLPVGVPAVTPSGWPDAKYLHVTVIAVKTVTVTKHLVVAIDTNVGVEDDTVPIRNMLEPAARPPEITRLAATILNALRDGDLGVITKNGQVLGDALFRSGTDTPASALTLDPLTTAFPGAAVTRAAVAIFSAPGQTPDDAEKAAAQLQGGVIATAVGVGGSGVGILPGKSGWPDTGYAYVTVIAITQRAVTTGPRLGDLTPDIEPIPVDTGRPVGGGNIGGILGGGIIRGTPRGITEPAAATTPKRRPASVRKPKPAPRGRKKPKPPTE